MHGGLSYPNGQGEASIDVNVQEDVKDVQREVQVLKLIGKHENVAELINVYEDSAYVHLVLELCQGGELFDRVVVKGTFSEKMAAGDASSTPSSPLMNSFSMLPRGQLPCTPRYRSPSYRLHPE